MAGINKVILVGNLGKDPETNIYEGGAKRVTFSLATSETYKDKAGNKVTQTEWHNIVCWRALADIAEQYLRKGSQIYLEGKIRSRSWEDNGVKKYATDITADTFQMLGAKNSGENQQDAQYQVPNNTSAQTSPTAAASLPNDEFSQANEPVDDLPF